MNVFITILSYHKSIHSYTHLLVRKTVTSILLYQNPNLYLRGNIVQRILIRVFTITKLHLLILKSIKMTYKRQFLNGVYLPILHLFLYPPQNLITLQSILIIQSPQRITQNSLKIFQQITLSLNLRIRLNNQQISKSLITLHLILIIIYQNQLQHIHNTIMFLIIHLHSLIIPIIPVSLQ